MSTIGTNVGALNASYFLGTNQQSLNNTMMKLSSGTRLSVPWEDAAGVAVSAKLSSTVKKLQAASEGAQDIISFAQTTDGFLKTVEEQITRMSELAQKATNGAFSDADRANYNTEFTRLRNQIDSIFRNSTFNGETIFASSNVSVSINAQGTTDLFQKVNLTNVTSLGIGSTTIGTTTAAGAAITALNTALQNVTTKRAEVNADISKFNFHISNIKTEKINVESANSRIKDIDVAEETMKLSKQSILLQASTAMLAQANAAQQTVLTLLR